MAKKPKLTVVTPTALPLPPRPLGEHGQALWDTIQAEYAIQDAGGVEQLMQICATLDLAEACAAQIADDGVMITGANGSMRDHPLLKSELGARAFVTRALDRLGLAVEPTTAPGRPGRPCGVFNVGGRKSGRFRS